MRIGLNLGGGPYIDSEGFRWEGDRAYAPGAHGCMDLPRTDIIRTRDAIAGTEDPVLFQSMRVGESFRYRFDLDPGTYSVRLLFAEIYWESNDAERQDLYLNGRRVMRMYNIFEEAGHDRAVTKAFRVRSRGGGIEVKFVGRSLPMHSGARACAIAISEE